MRTVLVIGACLMIPFACLAQDNCSLKVRVLSPQGLPTYAVVEVHEESGRELQQDFKGKDLEFCDLGILPVTVTAHLDPSCNEVSVRNVYPSPNKTRLLKIIYDSKDCSSEVLPVDRACDLLIRVRDSEGKYVANADIHLRKPKELSLRTDRFGRLLIRAGINEPAVGEAVARGFSPTEFSGNCTGYDPQEKVVQLKSVDNKR